jgi:putative tryptophan/tyrosine transport system substrate-binding protein
MVHLGRREFIALIGAGAAWPLAAQAQQTDQARRVGVLMHMPEHAEGTARVLGFRQALERLGWRDGHNLRLEIRWGAGDPERFRRFAAELVALRPDVIFASASQSVAALQRATRTVPIVFAGVIDPVGAGFVESMDRPGGNSTGFVAFEYAIAAKWLELLKEVAPTVKRAAVLRDPSYAAGIGQFAAIQAVGPIGVELSAISTPDTSAIEDAVAAFARRPHGGLIVTATPFATNHPAVIPALALRYKLPTVSAFRYYGGLISYGPDTAKQFDPAAGYVDRLLRGEKPADLPVQAPTKYDLVINLKTAKALGLEIPPTLLARADEVIE